MSFRSRQYISMVFLLLITSPIWVLADQDLRTSSSHQIAAAALAVDLGGRIEFSELELDAGQPPVTLKLERFKVFADDVQLVVHGTYGDELLQPPKNAYFKGIIDGRPDSRVVLSVFEGGGLRGIMSEHGSFWALGEALEQNELRVVARRLEDEAGSEGFACLNGSDDLQPPLSGLAITTKTTKPGETRPVTKRAAQYTARIAVETDQEFYNKFGNSTDATNYVGDIIAYGSTMYTAEVNTSWIVQHLSLWTTPDPWSEQSPNCGLVEFGRYWNDNMGGINRTLTSFFSGKSSNSGIAWVGVLCRGEFTYDISTWGCSLTPTNDNYGGAYSYIGGMDANFDINNPSTVWDIVAVTHEIGHNFNSPHTHCYGDLGGNANPIDECYNGQCGSSGCYCGTNTLCGTSGSGCGTIMSYCHLLSGGMSNLSLTLGLGHPDGIEPERVPERQYAHVLSQNASYPGCLELVVGDDLIFSDGFDNGTTSLWN